MEKKPHKHTNALINETSPYLLQHAHNPVNWQGWNAETLEKAKREDKLILVSVGYSACHWCHVMEHESFEDDTVAAIMNDHFVCIKVDREERPDIDQVYMLAVQLMTGQGGWPLNCFALPDGRPIYGGTYFQKSQWINLLLNLVDLYQNERSNAIEYAEKLMEGVKLAELVKTKEETTFTKEMLVECYNNWKLRFDPVEGGPDKAPKFPLPNNYEFLLRYAHFTMDKELQQHVDLTLKKMAFGGIYDQVGGGFARYSVDHYWKVPHFEKMLYDNAQLVTLYSEAYKATKNELYKEVVYETLEFTGREMTSPEGGFYSALDADSEGVEGKFYIWTKAELLEILNEDYNLFADYYNVNERGLWEHDSYILLRHDDDGVVAKRNKLSVNEMKTRLKKCRDLLLNIREKRVRPGLDNKILTSWNALMLKGYVDAYNAFGDARFLMTARKNAEFLWNHSNDGKRMYHLASLNTADKKRLGFLEDYSFTIEAFISLYQATKEEKYLVKAHELMEVCIADFQDNESGMFFFTSMEDTALITRKMEVSDNVIPASNSSIAKSLFVLGHYFEKENYIEMSRKMLNNVIEELENYGAGYSNWAMLLLYFTYPFYEVAIVGKSVDEKYEDFQKHYHPNVIFAISAAQSSLPLLKERFIKDQTMIYVCSGKTCKAPVDDVKRAMQQMQE